MSHTIRLGAELAAPPAKIFKMYLDRRIHAAITGAPVQIAPKVGAKFRAFEGALSGTILQLIPGRLIVQSWRSSGWKASEIDSTLIISLHKHGRGGTLIEVMQFNVPHGDFAGVSLGWEKYYWAPWREYLKARRKK